jgi:hypothetical protein
LYQFDAQPRVNIPCVCYRLLMCRNAES